MGKQPTNTNNICFTAEKSNPNCVWRKTLGSHKHIFLTTIYTKISRYHKTENIIIYEQSVLQFSAAAGTQKIRCTPTGGITSWDRSHFDCMNL